MTQQTSSHDLLFFVSQRVDESKARMAEDLHALRAAVRRWRDAKARRAADLRSSGVGGHAPHCGNSLDDLKNAERLLIAEMAGIDGEKVVKP